MGSAGKAVRGPGVSHHLEEGAGHVGTVVSRGRPSYYGSTPVLLRSARPPPQ